MKIYQHRKNEKDIHQNAKSVISGWKDCKRFNFLMLFCIVQIFYNNKNYLAIKK